MPTLTKEQLLNVWRTVLDRSYTDPLENDGGGMGFDIVAAIAATLERASRAADVSTQALYILPHSIQTQPPSAGATKATGQIVLTRQPPTLGDLDLEEGDELLATLTTPDGTLVGAATLELAADVVLPEGSTAPVAVAARAARPGYAGNVPDTRGRILRFAERTTITVSDVTSNATTPATLEDTGDGSRFDAGMVGAWVRFTAGPNATDDPRRIRSVYVGPSSTRLTLDGPALVAGSDNVVQVVDLNTLGVVVSQDGDFSGGVHGWLDALGAERQIGRNPNEVDVDYRERVKELPDVVSPNALERAVSRILTPLGIPYRIFESRADTIEGAAWDVHPWDDTAADVGLLKRPHFWQGDGFEYRGFYVVVERTAISSVAAAWDYEPGVGGVTPSSAWDFSFWDGADFGFINLLRRVRDEVDKTRMAGVPWLFVLVDSVP